MCFNLLCHVFFHGSDPGSSSFGFTRLCFVYFFTKENHVMFGLRSALVRTLKIGQDTFYVPRVLVR